MPALLKYFRYSVFGSFIICNTLIATIAIWNLSLINASPSAPVSSSHRADAYMIFVGCAGLLSIFPIIFCDIAESHFFITKAWFECAWAGLFCIFELAAAAASTAAGAQVLCGSSAMSILGSNLCTSSQVLQAFSWICTLFLLSYFLVLFVTCLFKARNEDPTIWHCAVRTFPWMSAHSELDSAPVSPEGQVPDKRASIISRFRWSKTPSIAAPRPRNAANQDTMRNAILSYRSGLSLEYQIEHFQPPTGRRVDIERPMPPIPSAQGPEHPTMATREATYATFGNALYPQQVQTVMPNQPSLQPQRQNSDQQSPPSPNPLGNWPQLNPPARGPGAKRKTISKGKQPLTAASSTSPQVPVLMPLAPLDLSAEMSSFAPDFTSTPPQQTRQSHGSATSSRLPPSELSRNMVRHPPPVVTASSPPVSARPIILPSSFNPSPRRPSGPRRPSIDEKKPAPLDLSRISNFNEKKRSS